MTIAHATRPFISPISSARAKTSSIPRRFTRAARERLAPRRASCGIDLGTTNSAIAIVRDGEAVIVSVQGSRTTPSVVSYVPGGDVVVGRDARKRANADARNTFHSVKRLIGRKFKNAKMIAREMPFKVVAHPETKYATMVGVDEDGAEFFVTPEECSSRVLRALLDAAESELGETIDKAVITVPAYFDDRQNASTEVAGKMAGLTTVRLLKEPVAAALAYGVDVEEDETVFVFDLGGGTFDVSILEVGGGVVEVLATGGDANLGGDDFDRAVAEWLASEAKTLGAEVDPRGALSVARKAREALSTQDKVEIPMPGGQTRVMTRSLFEKLVADVLRRMRQPVSVAADSAGVDLEAIMENANKKDGASRAAGRPFDKILLVGGATRTPCVRRFVENTMGRKANEALVNPDEAVALGAAIHAGSLEGSIGHIQTFNSLQANLMRALTAKMQGAPDARASDDDDDDWGPDDLDAVGAPS